MVPEIQRDAEARMKKSIAALHTAFNKIRTGRPHPSLLDHVRVDYYGTEMPINQVAGIGVEDGRSLVVSPWEKALLPNIEKAISASNLGLNPMSSGDVIRISMPPLTEETRQDYVREARQDAESARVSIRNIRRDANTSMKALIKDKKIGKDEEHTGETHMQQLTDQFIAEVDRLLQAKETELMAI